MLGLPRSHGAAGAHGLGDRASLVIRDDGVRLRSAAVDTNHNERHIRPAGTGSAAPCVSDERIPTNRVMVVPISRYHGQAMDANGASAPARAGTAALICFANTTSAITAMPTAIPVIASRCRARFQKIARKKPPRSAP